MFWTLSAQLTSSYINAVLFPSLSDAIQISFDAQLTIAEGLFVSYIQNIDFFEKIIK